MSSGQRTVSAAEAPREGYATMGAQAGSLLSLGGRRLEACSPWGAQAGSLPSLGSVGRNEPRYHATLTFDREKLLYDIKNYCYIEGHIMPEEQEHARHTTKDVGEEGNVDRVTRQLDLCHAIAVEMLYPYSKHEVHTSDEPVPWNDDLTEREQYRIDLLLPEDFSQTTVNLLEHLIHEWMVAKVVADWLSITNTEKQAVWEAKVADLEERVRTAIMSRRGCVRRRMSPF